jgi:membrane protease YdiL (CAAX protease family)
LRRYSGRQLIAAKCAVVALVAVIAGSGLADHGDLVSGIIVVFVLVGAAVAGFEMLSHAVALVLGRLWGADDTSADAPPTADIQPVQSPFGQRGRLQVRHVVGALLWSIAAGALVWLVAGLAATLKAGIGADEEAIIEALKPLVPVTLPASVLASGIALLLVLRGWSERLGRTRLAQSIGLSWGTSAQLLLGLAAGAALGLASLAVTPYLPEPPIWDDLIKEVAISSGTGRWAWFVSVVLLAPPVEELMFRGVTLGGLSESWGLRAATVVSALSFWLLHAPEWHDYWPGAVAIGLVTALVTWLRLRTGSLGPSIAAHLAYNLVLALTFVSVAPTGVPADGTDGPEWAHVHPAPSPEVMLERRLGGFDLLETDNGR